MRIYATMQITQEQKDRTSRLMKMGEKVQNFYNGGHCETYKTVCWRYAGIVVIKRNIADLIRIDVEGGGRSA